MSKVGFNMTMSLDGFIAGANDGPNNPMGDNGSHIFTWYGIGDTEYKMPGGEWKFNISAASAKLMDRALSRAGVLITGRRTFDIANAWGGQHPIDLPVVVLTHNPPEEWVSRKDSPFTFVTDGIESAVKQAKAIAGDKDVELGTASTLQQALDAGLVDELQIDLAPVVLGKGVRLFDHLATLPLVLEQIATVEGQGVTHIHYRIVK